MQAQRRSHFAHAVCVIRLPPAVTEMVPSAAAWRYWQRVRYSALSVGGNLSLVTLTLTFKLVQVRDHANLFSGSWDIWFRNKKSGSVKNRTLRSSLHMVKTASSPVVLIFCVIYCVFRKFNWFLFRSCFGLGQTLKTENLLDDYSKFFLQSVWLSVT